MFDFCPHCGQTIGQQQTPGQVLMCMYCGKTIGTVSPPKEKVMVDRTDALIAGGTAARCPSCNQIVQVKVSGAVRSFVPHQTTGTPRKMCPQSGKPVPTGGPAPAAAPAPAPAPIQRPATSKDLSKYITRDFIRVVACAKDGDPKIEELTLEYLDKADRVRLQIDALRDILGADFRVKAYPAALGKPHLGLWGNAKMCVIAAKHPQGGYQQMSDADMHAVIADIRQAKQQFM